MRFQRLDLNLLVALDALLTEKSVSLAADRLCLSQSATSSALGRLRDYFGDELLVLKGRQMILTARAEELIEPTRAVLEQIRTTIALTPEFDPSTCDRQIRIMASDFTTEVLIAPALRIIGKEAPEMRFEIQTMSSAPVEMLERGMIELLITVDFATSSDHPSDLMFQDDHVVIGDRESPAMRHEMTTEHYLSLPHVTARFGRSRIPAFEDWFTRRQKKQRRIEVIAPSFLSIPGLLIGTNRIATIHRRLAERLAEIYPLKIAEVPFAIPPIRELAQWDLSNNNDPVIRWVVEKMKEVAAAEVPTGGPFEENLDHSKIALEFESDQQNR